MLAAALAFAIAAGIGRIPAIAFGLAGAIAAAAASLALLRDPAWHQAAEDAGVAVLYVHGLNPYGFSWWRRTTHENVDLNRNFRDFATPPPANEQYDEIAAAVTANAS